VSREPTPQELEMLIRYVRVHIDHVQLPAPTTPAAAEPLPGPGVAEVEAVYRSLKP
jgi:hypothetical protein